MDILIFDMDGVLLKPNGYHRALQETVRLVGEMNGFPNVQLRDDQIAKFEALGISSEWHSSALCLAILILEKQKGRSHTSSSHLDLEELFTTIESQPMHLPALERARAAIREIAKKSGLPPETALMIVESSGSIRHSPTMNIFQELILGSETFQNIYQKSAQFETGSYLMKYDQRLLSEEKAEKVIRWASQPGRGAAIMTNRPSNGMPGGALDPDAEMGASLVGLEALPLVGFGEISWLAGYTQKEPGVLAKPAWQHAMAAILTASGWAVEDSLVYISREYEMRRLSLLEHLQGGTITVFEDTPGGLISVQEACDRINENGIQVDIQKVGIAAEESKKTALAAQGAVVYPSIDQALEGLDYF